MATHNQVNMVGFLLADPQIVNEGQIGEEKAIIQVRTVRREIEGYNRPDFADLVLFYGETELMDKCKSLRRFDVIQVKGVFNIINTRKIRRCPHCNHDNEINDSLSTFVYPQWISRIGSYKDYYNDQNQMPNAALLRNYREISNQCIIIGTVVTQPEFIEAKHGRNLCRYALGVDRKYYIKSQNDMTADYPWVYSYGKQAERDKKHLIDKESLIMVDGFIHNERIKKTTVCDNCGKEFSSKEIGTQFTPYSVEYLAGYKTDEEISMEEETLRRRKLNDL